MDSWMLKRATSSDHQSKQFSSEGIVLEWVSTVRVTDKLHQQTSTRSSLIIPWNSFESVIYPFMIELWTLFGFRWGTPFWMLSHLYPRGFVSQIYRVFPPLWVDTFLRWDLKLFVLDPWVFASLSRKRVSLKNLGYLEAFLFWIEWVSRCWFLRPIFQSWKSLHQWLQTNDFPLLQLIHSTYRIFSRILISLLSLTWDTSGHTCRQM